MDIMFGYLFLAFSILHWDLLQGFPEATLIATVRKDKTYAGLKTVINDFKADGGKGTILRGIELKDTSVFRILNPGVYVATVTVMFSSSKRGIVNLTLSATNDDEIPILQTLASIEPGDSTLQTSGVIDTYFDDKLSVVMSTSQALGITVKSRSYVSMSRIGDPYEVPSFFGTLTHALPLVPEQSTTLAPFSFRKKSRTFSKSEFFSYDTGHFSAPVSGLFCISVNIVVQKTTDTCHYTVYALINDNNKVAESVYQADAALTFYPIKIFLILYLDKGDIISVIIKANYAVKSTVLDTSTLSGSLLSGPYEKPNGFHLIAQTSKMVVKRGWTSLNMDKLSSTVKGGRSANSVFTISQNRFAVDKEGIYLYSAIVKLSSLSYMSGLVIAISINGIPMDAKDGNFASTALASTSVELTMTLNTLLYLRIGDFVTISIYQPFESPWYIEKGSIFSVCRIQTFSSTFNLGLHYDKKIFVGWSEITGWRQNDVTIQYNFALSYSQSQGRFHVLRSGVYYVHARLVFVYADVTFIQAAVAINGEPIKADGLSARRANAVESVTLMITSTVYLRRGEFISVFIYLEGIKSIQVDNASQFSLMYFAPRDFVVGFHATMPSDLLINANDKWISLDALNPKSTLKRWSFRSTSFDSVFRSGFLIPRDGIYFVAANLIIGDTDLLSSKSYFKALLAIGADTSDQVLVVKQSTQYNSQFQKSENEITLSLSGSVKLLQGQKVFIKVFSKVDNSWVVRQASGLSILMLYPVTSQHVNGFLLPHRKSQSGTKITEIIRGWSSIGTGGGRFELGRGTSIYGEEQLQISITGIYIVSFSIEFKGSGRQGIKLGIVLTPSDGIERRFFCAKGDVSSSSSYMGCNLLLYLKENTNLGVIAHSQDKDKGLRYGNHGFFSAIRIFPLGGFPFIYKELKKTASLIGENQSVRDWNVLPTEGAVAYGEKTFKKRTAYFFASVSGYYLVSICLDFPLALISPIVLSIQLGKSNEALNATIQKTQSPQTWSFTSIIMADARWQVSILLSSTQRFTLGTRTRVSFSLMPSHLLPNLLRFDLSSNSHVKEERNIIFSGWQSSRIGHTKQRDFLLNSKTLYLIVFNLYHEVSGHDFEVYVKYSSGKRIALYRGKIYGKGKRTLSIPNILLSEVTVPCVLEANSLYPYDGITSKQTNVFLINIGQTKKTVGVVTRSSQRIAYDREPNTWTQIRGIYLEYIHDVYFIDWMILLKKSGLYILVLNIIANSPERAMYEIGIYSLREKSVINGLYSRKAIQGDDTLSIMASVQLDRGLKIQPVIRTDTSSHFSVQQGSMFSLIMLENMEAGIIQNFGPVILGELIPSSSVSFELGKQQKLHCNAVGDGVIQYYWYRDSVMLEVYTKELLLKGHRLEIGKYYCEAKMDDRKMVSVVAHVNVYDVDECSTGAHNCTITNQTCVNTDGGYYCSCQSGFAIRGRECLSLRAAPGYQVKFHKNYLPVAVRVLVPILCIVIFFIFALSIYTCYKHQKTRSSEFNPEMTAFTENNHELNGEGDVEYGASAGFYELGEKPGEDDGGFNERLSRQPSPAT